MLLFGLVLLVGGIGVLVALRDDARGEPPRWWAPLVQRGASLHRWARHSRWGMSLRRWLQGSRWGASLQRWVGRRRPGPLAQGQAPVPPGSAGRARSGRAVGTAIPPTGTRARPRSPHEGRS